MTRKKNAVPTNSFVSRLLYFTCMKNRMTSVALMIAIAMRDREVERRRG